MGKTTPIEWCDSTVNPTMGCDGCELWTNKLKICYAGKAHEFRKSNIGFASTFKDVTKFPGRMEQAGKWSELTGQPRPSKPWLDGLPRMIFVSDMSDALSKSVSLEYLRDEIIWQVLNQNGIKHSWLWLTKRPDRMVQFSQWLEDEVHISWPSNLWVGTSVTTQKTTSRVRDLLKVGDDRTTRFVSVEPQWEPISLSDTLEDLDWVIQGGESATIKHPFDIAWADMLRDECQTANVPYFLKQLGSVAIEDGERLQFKNKKGVDWNEWSDRLRVRQVPVNSESAF